MRSTYCRRRLFTAAGLPAIIRAGAEVGIVVHDRQAKAICKDEAYSLKAPKNIRHSIDFFPTEHSVQCYGVVSAGWHGSWVHHP